MVIHAIYDAGTHHMKTTNRPAFYWMMAEAFGNFLGGGVWGFMITLPQVNLYAHGTQWTVSHGHFAFWGAYACGVLSVIYLVLQKTRGLAYVDGTLGNGRSRHSIYWLVAMVGALLVSGFAQAFVERAIGGSTHAAFVAGQENRWFVEGMVTRFIFGLIFAAGYVALVWDLPHARQTGSVFGCRAGCRMNEISLLETALLLGLYVALAGSYGLVYAIARLQEGVDSPPGVDDFIRVARSTAIAVVAWTPLEFGWKGLIVASSVAFLAIPPITWRLSPAHS